MIFVRSLLAELARRELDTDEFLRATGLDRPSVAAGVPLLSYEQAVAAARQAVKSSGDEAIGLDAGLATPASALKLVSLLLLAQPDLRAAVETFQRFAGLVSEGPRFELVLQDDIAVWTMCPAVPPSPDTRVMVDYAIAVAARVAGSLLGLAPGAPDPSALLEVGFQHEPPVYVDRYRDAFRCKVLFGQACNALVFRRDLLEHRLAHADEFSAAAARRSAEQKLRAAQLDGRWVERVRFVLEHLEDLAGLDSAGLAQRLHTNERSLRRRLDRENSSFGELLDEARRQRASKALRETRIPLPDLSASLGFSTPSAFGRAFRTWTGQTPASYRRSLRQTSGSSG